MKMSQLGAVLLVLVLMTMGAPGFAAHQADSNQVAGMRVIQFYGVKENSALDKNIQEMGNLTSTLQSRCGWTQGESPLETRSVGTAFVGIFIDWLVGRWIGRMSERAKRRIEAHTSIYSNPLAYQDQREVGLWGGSQEQPVSCVLAQRLACPKPSSGVGTECTVLSSTAFILQAGAREMRILPLGYHVGAFAPKETGERIDLAADIELYGISHDKQGGRHWRSGMNAPQQDALITGRCDADRKTHQVIGSCQSDKVMSLDWSQARVVPLPPGFEGARRHRSARMKRAAGEAVAPSQALLAFKVSVAETGTPPRYLKLFADFLENSKGDVSGVLATALKKKLEVDQ
ncbi:hypothetical protein [Pseudoxanthomonas putridarboris]|uniref:Uncharacterized protein n=1 Tax=Pseudoxanthomonas putridarboris TaxID=752605 RepID=A0ABU9J248_9GAMM